MKEVKTPKKPLAIYYAIVLLVLMLLNFVLVPWMSERQVKEVDYGTFMSMTEDKDIGRVDVESNQIIFTDKDEKQIYKTGLMNDPDLTQRLYDAGAQFSSEIVEQASPLMSFLLSFVLPIVLFVWLGNFMNKKLIEKAGGANSMMFGGVGKSNAKVYVQSTHGIRFTDVAGEDEAKENLQEIVDYLHDPKKYEEIGASMPKGILLVGPPGTGKTMLAKAVAGESNVPFFSISGSEFVEMFVGMGASKVRDLFKQAKEKAPCIVFIDEIDAIGIHHGDNGEGGVPVQFGGIVAVEGIAIQQGQAVFLQEGQQIDRDDLLRKFVDMQYKRNDIAFTRGTFRVRGDTVEIIPVYEELAIRIEFFGDEIDRISTLHPLTGDVIAHESQVHIFPASHYVAGPERMERALKTIQQELDERTAELHKQGKELEAQRLTMRTTYDLEMLSQVGTCSGVENYSRHFDNRAPGTPPHTLLDFFPDDFLLVIDESHVTVPQIGAMYEGDASRKRTLVEHGFRLPSAMDNRPLKWPEFQERVGQTVYLSATPGDYELGLSDGVVEQIIRPTGLVDPQIDVRPVEGQIDDLLAEIKDRVARNERALVTTLTKKMAEDLTDYLLERGIKVEYLHSDVDTLRRVELLRELREGKIDVIVGINLLREGLDLPEVSLVAILDADKEGFLRSYRSLIQTIGRAARNVSGTVVMYADDITEAMRKAIDETNRRRDIQIAYNKEHGIDPKPLIKKISDVNDMLAKEDVDTQTLLGTGYRNADKAGNSHLGVPHTSKEESGRRHEEILKAGLPAQDLADLIRQLSEQMHTAAEQLQFELAARLRDEIRDLKKELRQMTEASK